jgi:hypothetical protein
MSDVANKSVVLNGNLKDLDYLNYYFAKTETRHGLWQVCIKDIAISFFEDINVIVQITTNLVIDQRIQNYKHETFNPIISTVLLKGKNGEKKLQQMEKTWFEVNKPDSEVKIFFKNAETNLIVNQNCSVFVSLLLKQIK